MTHANEHWIFMMLTSLKKYIVVIKMPVCSLFVLAWPTCWCMQTEAHNGIVEYAVLKCVSLWNQCDIPLSCIVCDIKQRSYLLFVPNTTPFIINSVILSLQLDMYETIWIAWHKHIPTFVWCAVWQYHFVQTPWYCQTLVRSFVI